jgi:hypothetical protein
MAVRRPDAAIAASVSATTLPRKVESIFLMRTPAPGGHRRAIASPIAADASAGERWRDAQFTETT